MSQEGGCLCGQLRYRLSAAPLLTAICHCRHCQRQSGTAFSVVSAYPSGSFTQSGESRVFMDQGESGRAVARHFCPACGSPILSLAEAMPDVVLIKAGTLDDFGTQRPGVEVYCDYAASWLPMLAQTRFPRSNI